MLLTDEVRGNLKDLVVRANKLFQHHCSLPVAAVAAEVDIELAEAVAALGIKAGKAGFKGGKKKEGSFKGSAGAGGGRSTGDGSGGGSAGGSGRSYYICMVGHSILYRSFPCGTLHSFPF